MTLATDMRTTSGCVLALFTVGVVLLSAIVTADQLPSNGDLYDMANNNHVDVKRPFFVGSRYGRAQGSIPRNDRFFIGSRYGKRSELTKEIETDTNNGAGMSYLACLHTGVSNLYRCYGQTQMPVVQPIADNLDPVLQ